MKKVLITDDAHQLLQEGLEKAGFVCDYQPDISEAEVLRQISRYAGIIINSKIRVDKILLDTATALEFVGRLGSGLEIIDQEYALHKGVAVLSSPEGNCNAVAEHALGMLLAHTNHLIRADSEVRRKLWRREANRGHEIMGKTIGIIGFGHTGSSFAQKLAGLGVKVLAYDKYKKDYATEYAHVVESSLSHLLEESDIISLHLPLTAETRNFVDHSFLKNCKRGLVLINTSRGVIVNTKDLLTALGSGQVSGACLDVFENEKPSTFSEEEERLYNQLYINEKVVLSPHIAGWTYDSKKRLAEVLLRKILSVTSK